MKENKTRNKFEELGLALENLKNEIIKAFIPITLPVINFLCRLLKKIKK